MELDPWGPVVGLLFEDGSSDYVLGALQRAGIATSFSLTEQEAYSHNTRKRAYKSHVDAFYTQLDQAQRRIVTRNIAIELSKSQRGLECLNEVLGRIGWAFKDGTLKPSQNTSIEMRIGPAMDQPASSDQPTSLRQKAHLLLKKLHESTSPGGHPVDDVTRLETPLTEEEVRSAFYYLKEQGLIQTFSLPHAARINGKGIDAIEGNHLIATGRDENGNWEKGAAFALQASVREKMPRKVFIVHGHDSGPREAVARFLERLGFEAIILQEQANQGRTIIEKVEAHGDVRFAVVLLTPDDTGCKVGGDLRPRPRQNVIVELGYFFGRLGRSRVCALATNNTMELPTDFAGVVWEPFDAHGAWKQVLVRELKAAGFEVDLSKAL